MLSIWLSRFLGVQFVRVRFNFKHNSFHLFLDFSTFPPLWWLNFSCSLANVYIFICIFPNIFHRFVVSRLNRIHNENWQWKLWMQLPRLSFSTTLSSFAMKLLAILCNLIVLCNWLMCLKWSCAMEFEVWEAHLKF